MADIFFLDAIIKNYICFIKRDDSIECYNIHNFPNFSERKLSIIVDLETIYSKSDNIQKNISKVKQDIFNILNKNQGSHTKLLGKMLEERKDISSISDIIHKKKGKLNGYVQELEKMLTQLSNKEKNIVEKTIEIEDNFRELQTKGLHNDIEKSHALNKYEAELNKINILKQEVIKNLMKLRNSQENIFLFTDKLLFDNTVMMDSIFQNINEALEYTN
mgnify:CR=1 FL=1